jgi:hypothetical protein
MKKLSDWIVVDGYCATRILDGGDVNNVAVRVAFIEKTPRVRTAVFTSEKDYLNWFEGPKGVGGCIEFYGETVYGFYAPSRAWCDAMLIEMGYDVPNPVVL